jgi:hypothetical protein
MDNEEFVCLSQYYKIEKVLADTLLLLDGDSDSTRIDVESDISLYEQTSNIQMHEHQKEAVRGP